MPTFSKLLTLAVEGGQELTKYADRHSKAFGGIGTAVNSETQRTSGVKS